MYQMCQHGKQDGEPCLECQKINKEKERLKIINISNENRRARIAELKRLEKELKELIRTCPHEMVPDDDIINGYDGPVQIAICTICGQQFSWYCEKSPTKKCECDCADFCVHCGRTQELPK